MVVWSRIRKDFPVLNQLYEGKSLIYFDSACMALKPIQVWEAMEYYYKYLGACGGAGRSTHSLGAETSLLTEQARQKVTSFINAESPNEIIWTRNATEGLNIIAATIPLTKDENVVTTTLEHHSGMLPFYKRCTETGSELRLVEAKEDGTFDPADFEEKIDDKTKIVSFVHASNLTGSVAPLEEVVRISHEHDALVISDDAQFAPHQKLDVRAIDVDFSVISIHKAVGPTGIGVLYGKYELLEELDMFLVGGDVIEDVVYENNKITPKYLPPPHKFEAGLQNYGGILGAGAAVDYLEKIGMDNIHNLEQKFSRKLLEGVLELDKFEIMGPMDYKQRTALVSFRPKSDSVNHNDVVEYFNELLPQHKILMRGGNMCVHPFQYQIGINPRKGEGVVRASLYIYNTMEEIEIFLGELENFAKVID
ncbi:MAG: aminotransferase class V-fold PLP-dependent enzyme [Candidatus Heimdallarchaeota archaeon]|nr:aminotransferase class V-fold PLP-dependent enzyme [Candidatus Heimdallarchaeota archaeon]MCK4954420.1 aminotransferase class V-fold PLP-dependent enzyme [Candidatus Heimdallarchaeota archaeon]